MLVTRCRWLYDGRDAHKQTIIKYQHAFAHWLQGKQTGNIDTPSPDNINYTTLLNMYYFDILLMIGYILLRTVGCSPFVVLLVPCLTVNIRVLLPLTALLSG